MPVSPRLKPIPYVAAALVLLLVGLYSLRGGGSGESRALPTGAGAAGAPASASGSDDYPADSGVTVGSADRVLVIDVGGAVRRPGVYRMASGSRVIDAIRKAGGPADNALPSAINRAAKLADGQQVVVPAVVTTPGTAGGSTAGSSTSTAGSGGAILPGAVGAAPISLGSATAEQLEEIDGIGPVTAQNIIEFRDSKGGLASIDEIDAVSGIGPVTMEALRSSLQP